MSQRMGIRHTKMFQRIIAMLKAEHDYSSIDEIRILNDGGGTGTWIVAIRFVKPRRKGREWRVARIPFHAIFAETEHESAKNIELYD